MFYLLLLVLLQLGLVGFGGGCDDDVYLFVGMCVVCEVVVGCDFEGQVKVLFWYDEDGVELLWYFVVVVQQQYVVQVEGQVDVVGQDFDFVVGYVVGKGVVWDFEQFVVGIQVQWCECGLGQQGERCEGEDCEGGWELVLLYYLVVSSSLRLWMKFLVLWLQGIIVCNFLVWLIRQIDVEWFMLQVWGCGLGIFLVMMLQCLCMLVSFCGVFVLLMKFGLKVVRYW